MQNYTLEAAAKKQNEIQESLKSQPQNFLLPVFHAFSPAGWCNDPNGFSFFGGKCHLFFSIIRIQRSGDRCTGDIFALRILCAGKFLSLLLLLIPILTAKDAFQERRLNLKTGIFLRTLEFQKIKKVKLYRINAWRKATVFATKNSSEPCD